MWTEAAHKSALKKKEAKFVKTKEETKQGATFTQVVPKSLVKKHPFSGTLPKLPQSQFLWTLKLLGM